VLTVGQELSVRIVSIDPAGQRLSLTRLTESGAEIGSEEAGDVEAVREALDQTSQQGSLGTNLGNLFKQALKGDK